MLLEPLIVFSASQSSVIISALISFLQFHVEYFMIKPVHHLKIGFFPLWLFWDHMNVATVAYQEHIHFYRQHRVAYLSLISASNCILILCGTRWPEEYVQIMSSKKEIDVKSSLSF